MSDDFDFELDLSPLKKDNQITDKGNINQDLLVNNKNLSLQEKLNILKNNINTKITDLPNNVSGTKSNNDKGQNLEIENKNQGFNSKNQNNKNSNLQNLLSKLKANNDCIKKQPNLQNNNPPLTLANDKITEHRDNSLFSIPNTKNTEEKINEDLNILKTQILDQRPESSLNEMEKIKINENFPEDFNKLNHNRIEKSDINDSFKDLDVKNNEKFNLSLSDSIEEIGNIVESMPEKNILVKDENFSQKIENKPNDIDNQIKKTLDKINIFNNLDKKPEIIENHSLDKLICEQNKNVLLSLNEDNEQTHANDNKQMTHGKKDNLIIDNEFLGSFDRDSNIEPQINEEQISKNYNEMRDSKNTEGTNKNFDIDLTNNLSNLSNEIQEYKEEESFLNTGNKVEKNSENKKIPFNDTKNSKNEKVIDVSNPIIEASENIDKVGNMVKHNETHSNKIDPTENISKQKNTDESKHKSNLISSVASLNHKLGDNKLNNEFKNNNIRDIFKILKDEDENNENEMNFEHKSYFSKIIQEKKSDIQDSNKPIEILKENKISLNHIENEKLKIDNDISSIDDDIPEIDDHSDEVSNIINLDKQFQDEKKEEKFNNNIFFNKKINLKDEINTKNNNFELQNKSERDKIKNNLEIAKKEIVNQQIIDKKHEEITKKNFPKEEKQNIIKNLGDDPITKAKIDEKIKKPTVANSKAHDYIVVDKFHENNVESNVLKTQEIIDIGDEGGNEKNTKCLNNIISKDEKYNQIMKSEESIQDVVQKKHLDNKISDVKEVNEKDSNDDKEKKINKPKKIERFIPLDKKNDIEPDKISMSSNSSQIDISKFKIFIDFNIDQNNNELHLNEILGQYFDERVREKNIRFLLRRKSILINELFIFYTLREYNILNKIRKAHLNYSLKVEEILNEYQNKNDYDNLFKKAIGDDNNNKQNLIKLLQKDKIKDKSFYLFDNISCLYDIEALANRFRISNENFDLNWEPNKILRYKYDEEEIINLIYKKNEIKILDNNNNKKEEILFKESVPNIEPNENENYVNVNSYGNEDSKPDKDKSKTNKNKSIKQSNSKILSQVNTSNENMQPFNLTILKSEIKCWRESVADGDSFYRMFMFGLIEYYILKKNLHEIKKTLFDVNRIYENSLSKSSKKNSFLFSTRKIDYSKVVIIFNLIIEALKQNQIDTAYEILLNAYNLEDKSFDLVLIGYIRIVFWKFIAETKLSIEGDNKNKSKKEYEEVNIETLNTYQLEPYKLSFNLASTIFNVNLDIVYMDKIPLQDCKYEKIKCSKVKFNTNSIHESPTISLLYNFNSFGKYYSHSFYEKNKNILGKYYSKVYKKVILEDKYNCDKCGSKNKKVNFKRYEYSSCFNCLKNYLDYVIQERVKVYEIENFISREYYCRPIKIKQKFVIDDYDFLLIFGKTLSSYIMELVKKCCFVCDDIKLNEQIFNLDCTCNYCHSCLKKKIEELTNENYVLNTFEKNIYLSSDDPRKLCGCNTIFDIDTALKSINMDLNVYVKKANERLDSLVNLLCFKCGTSKQSGEQISNRSSFNFTDIKILPSNNENKLKNEKIQDDMYQKKTLNNKENDNKYVSLADHVICNNCLEEFSRNLTVNQSNNTKENGNKGNKNTSNENPNLTINCNICEAEHLIETKLLKNISKKSACCQGGCIIY